MKIRIISPGRIREPYLKQAVDQALLRLNRKMAVELIELADSPDQWPLSRALALEGEQMHKRLQPTDFVIALDLAGHWPQATVAGTLNSEVNRWMDRARGDLVFLIGGSNGFEPSVLTRSDVRICLSKLTFTHQLARLILLDLLDQAL